MELGINNMKNFREKLLIKLMKSYYHKSVMKTIFNITEYVFVILYHQNASLTVHILLQEIHVIVVWFGLIHFNAFSAAKAM